MSRYVNVNLNLKRKSFDMDQVKHLYEVKATTFENSSTCCDALNEKNSVKRKCNKVQSKIWRDNQDEEVPTKTTLVKLNLKQFLNELTEKENDRNDNLSHFSADTANSRAKSQSVLMLNENCQLNFASSIDSGQLKKMTVNKSVEMCHLCEKRVYLMERESVMSFLLHKSCFKCSYCSRALRHGSYSYTRNSSSLKCKLSIVGSSDLILKID